VEIGVTAKQTMLRQLNGSFCIQTCKEEAERKTVGDYSGGNLGTGGEQESTSLELSQYRQQSLVSV
jgi:hypothetical protein